MPTQRIDVMHPAELSPTDLQSWNALRTRTAPVANPFMSPEFCQAVGRVRPGARVAVVRQDGEAVGFFSFERGRWGRGRAIGLGVSDCQGAVLHPDVHVDPHRLLRASSLSVWEFNHLEGGQDLFLPFATGRFASPVIDLGSGYAHYENLLRTRSRKFLKSARAQDHAAGTPGRASEVRVRRTRPGGPADADGMEIRPVPSNGPTRPVRPGMDQLYWYASLPTRPHPAVRACCRCSTQATGRSPRTSDCAHAPCCRTGFPPTTGTSRNSPPASFSTSA